MREDVRDGFAHHHSVANRQTVESGQSVCCDDPTSAKVGARIEIESRQQSMGAPESEVMVWGTPQGDLQFLTIRNSSLIVRHSMMLLWLRPGA